MAETVTSAGSAYGSLDRLLHRIAFAHPKLQRVLGDVENDLFSRQLTEVKVERPVFITGLPRSGTTLLLEMLYGTGEFATFTYRQMPFVLNPLLWDRLSSGSRKPAQRRERAHGDKMLVGYDSPEAFEEVLWLNYLSSELFDEHGMRTLCAGDLTEEFKAAFRRLAGKLICLSRHAETDSPMPRYLSKNNANIARLPAVASVFADARLLVCFRHPVAHVASLLTQHQRFNAMHDDDAFAARYMAWIGHHDFGRNFRPIGFAEPIDGSRVAPAFWLQYWIDAYRHALDHAPAQVRFVDFDSLLAEPHAVLDTLAESIGLAHTDRLLAAASTLRAPTTTTRSLEGIPANRMAVAEALHRELSARVL